MRQPRSHLPGLVGLLLLVSYLSPYGAAREITQAASSSRAVSYGVNSHPIWVGADRQDPAMSAMKSAGVQTARIDVPWDVVEPVKGVMEPGFLANIDYSVRGLASRNIQPLLVVVGAPHWANGSDSSQYPPLRDDDYVSFLGFLMRRYGSSVNAYEIWNEPDGEWEWHQPDPARYTALLKKSYTYAKSLNPNVTILAGSLSNVWADSQTYLRAMYANGAGRYFDVLSAHVYTDPPAHGNGTPEEILSSFQTNIIPIMRDNGDAMKRVWITEHGFNTGRNGVSEKAQGQFLTRAYAAAHAIPQVDRLYYYEWTDGCQDAIDPECNYGLIDSSWRKKPAYDAFRKLATASSGAATIRHH